jgi:hypothetical protein
MVFDRTKMMLMMTIQLFLSQKTIKFQGKYELEDGYMYILTKEKCRSWVLPATPPPFHINEILQQQFVDKLHIWG